MADTTYLDWPFFEPRHAELARSLDQWAANTSTRTHGSDLDEECRALVRALGKAGGCAIRWPARRMAAPARRSTRAPSA
jgi:hypothetical protein